MSEALVTQWKDRVVEAESEVQVVLDEINSLLQSKDQLSKDIEKYQSLVNKEKSQLLRKLEAAQKRAEDFETQCETLNKEKDRVEAIYTDTLDEYEAFHEQVKSIKAQESMLEGRADLERALQMESVEWAEEEHALRSKINHLDAVLKNSKRTNQQELAQAEAKLKETEAMLHSDRMGRDTTAATSSSFLPGGSMSRVSTSRQASVAASNASFASNAMNNTSSALSSKAGSRKRDLLGDVTNN